MENEFYYVKNNKYNQAIDGNNPRHDGHDLNFNDHLHKRQRVNKSSTYWYCKTSGCGGSVTISTEEEVVNSVEHKPSCAESNQRTEAKKGFRISCKLKIQNNPEITMIRLFPGKLYERLL